MTFETIRLELQGEVAMLTLNQPASRNGLTRRMQDEMLEAAAAIREDRQARALVVSGAGASFCSGADLGALESTGGSSLGDAVARTMEESSNPLILALQQLPVPVVCAVNGPAAGAGVGIALAADVVIAARSAFFLVPFLPRLGIVPDLGSTWFLTQHLGRARAMGLMLLGGRLPAETAAEWGLIWRCVDDAALMEEAVKIASQLAKGPAHAALEARRALDAASRQDLQSQLEYEKERQRELLDLPSFREGVQAFFEKREPRFSRA